MNNVFSIHYGIRPRTSFRCILIALNYSSVRSRSDGSVSIATAKSARVYNGTTPRLNRKHRTSRVCVYGFGKKQGKTAGERETSFYNVVDEKYDFTRGIDSIGILAGKTNEIHSRPQFLDAVHLYRTPSISRTQMRVFSTST